MVSSTKPHSFRVSVWMATCTSYSSATFSEVSIEDVVDPQSSWTFSPIAPARICSASGSTAEACPLPNRPMLMGSPSAACSIRWMCHLPGVTVVALVPSAGPVPPPIIVVTPLHRAAGTWSGEMKWMWESTPPAVRIFCSPAMMSVLAPITMSTPSVMCGLPALPIRKMWPSRSATSAL